MKVSYNWLKKYCECDLPAAELAARLSHAGLGVESFEPQGDDWLLDVEVKSNRPDCLCHIGIAREVAALTGAELRVPGVELAESPDRSFDEVASVEVTAPELCPHYTARLIVGVKVGPSPAWMRRCLELCGVRPVNNVVDVTNYVMLECGQPLHAFDLSLVGGRRVVVRRARPGETIRTIDGVEHELAGDECVIADESRPIALAGVMGGEESEITESTRDVLLESARFEPRSNRRTARRHGLITESSYRYQRGIDPEVTEWASRRACQLICELAGGTVLKGSANIRSDSTQAPEVTMRHARAALVLGTPVPREESVRILRGLQLQIVRDAEEEVTVRVPSWRADLRREIDLIEEVARIYGYDRIGETAQFPVRPAQPSVAEVVQRRARRLLAGAGFDEVMTYSLVPAAPLQLAQPWCEAEPVAVRNPVTVDRVRLRVTNMANLLHVKKLNQDRGTPRVDLFELGRVFIPRAGEDTPQELLCLTLLTDREEALRVLKGLLANLTDELGIESPVEESVGCAGPFDPEQALLLRMDGQLIGCVGVTSSAVAEQLDLRRRPALMEVDFDALARRSRLSRPYSPVPQYPATRRDVAVVVDEGVRWADVEKAIRQEALPVLESVEFLSVYRGDPVPEGRKSLAFSLTFRRGDRTITAAEAEEARRAVLAALERRVGAVLR